MRYTKTKLEKIMMIGFARIDQIIDKACDDLDEIKPKNKSAGNIRDFGAIPDIDHQGLDQFAGVDNEALYAQLKNSPYFRQAQAMMNRQSQGFHGRLMGLVGAGEAMLR
jgi:hypothetical protein